MLWIAINSECQKNGFKGYFDKRSGKMKWPIDLNCSALRFDGFDKYNTKTHLYENNTKYMPYKYTKNGIDSLEHFELDECFYNETYLLVDDCIKPTRINNRRKTTDNDFWNNLSNTNGNSDINLSSQLTELSEYGDDHADLAPDNSQITSLENSLLMDTYSQDDHAESIQTAMSGNNMKNNDNDDVNEEKKEDEEKKSHEAKEKQGKYIEYLGDKAKSFLERNYGCFMDLLTGHDITKVIVSNKTSDPNNDIVLISCGKNTNDRTCPFTNRVHHKNNRYYIWYQNKQVLQTRCHGNDCKGRYMTVYKNQKRFVKELMDIDADDNINDDENSDDLWTDVDLGELYLEFNKNLLFTTSFRYNSNTDGTFFHYNPKTGLWFGDKGSHILKKNLATKFKRYVKQKWNDKIKDADNDEKKKQMMAQRSLLNRKLGDFKNIKSVVESLKTLCVEDIELDSNPWYFVTNNTVWDLHSNKKVIPKKTEYITNLLSAKFDIREFDQEMDDYIDNMIFKKLFPNKEERETILIYLSTILNGKTLKKFCVNLGMFSYYKITLKFYLNFTYFC